MYYNCKFNLINLKQGTHTPTHGPASTSRMHRAISPGHCSGSHTNPCPGHYYRLNSTKLQSNLVPRFSLLPSVGTDRRESWERGWLQSWTEEIGNLVIPPPHPPPPPPPPPPPFPQKNQGWENKQPAVPIFPQG